MEIKIQKTSGDVSIKLKGNLNGSTACQIEKALDFIEDSGVVNLVIDFAQVRRLEYFGVALLANALKSQRSQLTLTGLKPSAENLFKRFGLIASQPHQTNSIDPGQVPEYPSWQTS
jgi:anti-anti-sigma factor